MVDAGMRGAAGDLDVERAAALAAGDHIAADAAGLGVEHGAGALRRRFDVGAALERADFLVRREQRHHREGQASDGVQRAQRKDVGDQAALHIGDARTVSEIAGARIGPRRHRALFEYCVAMAEQQHVAVLSSRQFGADNVAESDLGRDADFDAFAGQQFGNGCADRVGAGLVETVGVDVDQPVQQRFHFGSARRQPGDDFVDEFVLALLRHRFCRHLLRSSMIRVPSSPTS
jgi:hypothetical protein